VTRRAIKVVTGVLTSLGTLIRTPRKTLAGALPSAGVIIRKIGKRFTGGIRYIVGRLSSFNGWEDAIHRGIARLTRRKGRGGGR
jgi:hypothetical protein